MNAFEALTIAVIPVTTRMAHTLVPVPKAFYYQTTERLAQVLHGVTLYRQIQSIALQPIRHIE